MPKGPIPFRPRLGGKGGRRPPHGGGEIDEWLWYWRERIRRPLALGGRSFWTERMLYGNAIAGGILLAISETLRFGFNVLGIASAILNALFVAFIWYYAVPWLSEWIHGALSPARRSPDTPGLKNELIAFSGIFILLPLVTFLSFIGALWVAWAVTAVLLWRVLRVYFPGSALAVTLEALAGSTLMALVSLFFFR